MQHAYELFIRVQPLDNGGVAVALWGMRDGGVKFRRQREFASDVAPSVWSKYIAQQQLELTEWLRMTTELGAE